ASRPRSPPGTWSRTWCARSTPRRTTCTAGRSAGPWTTSGTSWRAIPERHDARSPSPAALVRLGPPTYARTGNRHYLRINTVRDRLPFPDDDLTDPADRIHREHEGCESALRAGLAHAIAAGRL